MRTPHAKGKLRIGNTAYPSQTLLCDDRANPGVVGHDHPSYGGFMVAESVSPPNARRLAACWNAFEGVTTEAIEELGPVAAVIADPAQSRIFELEAERDALLTALQRYEAARSALFDQCLSNPITNAWGKQVDVTLLNEAHELAHSALRDRVRQDIARGSRQSNGKLPG